jgi:hypothetical protein
MVSDPRNGKEWLEWSQYVLKGIENLNEDVKDIRAAMGRLHNDLASIRTEIEMLKVKSGLWGATAGALVTAAAALLIKMFGGKVI